MEYFLTDNAARAIKTAEGKMLQFERTEYFSPTASWWGTLAVDNPADIAALKEAAKSGGIYSISQEEYEAQELKKKKTSVSPNLIALQPWHAPQMGAERKDAAPAETASAPAAAIETVDSVLSAKPVEKAPTKPRK